MALSWLQKRMKSMMLKTDEKEKRKNAQRKSSAL
jgi:hypothetical protein